MNRNFLLYKLRQISCKYLGLMPVSDHEDELAELKTSLQDTQPVGSLVNCCRLVPARNSDADVVL